MKTLRTIVAISTVLIVALWWAVTPPRAEPEIVPPDTVSEGMQRPAGEAGACDTDGEWRGGQCVVAAPDPALPDTRHVTTVDVRRR